jgi:hypothetical protein
MSGDHGAKALAERLRGIGMPMGYNGPRTAAAILGPHGLFVEDVREHEPSFGPNTNPDYRVQVRTCSCGWVQTFPDHESFFDHIGTQP